MLSYLVTLLVTPDTVCTSLSMQTTDKLIIGLKKFDTWSTVQSEKLPVTLDYWPQLVGDFEVQLTTPRVMD